MTGNIFESFTKNERQAFRSLRTFLREGRSLEDSIAKIVPLISFETISCENFNIVAILPIREGHKIRQSLIVYDDAVRKVPSTPSECIRQLIRMIDGIKYYPSYCAALQKLLNKKYYKLPCATSLFTLIPIESVENGAWLSIQKIDDISFGRRRYVQAAFQMTNQLSFPTTSGKRSINHMLQLAYRCSAIVCLDSLYTTERAKLPLHRLIEVPIRPFNVKIFEELQLSNFFYDPWQFRDFYIQMVPRQ